MKNSKAEQLLNNFLNKKAEDDCDINGSTDAVLDVAKKFGPVDEDRAVGLPGKKASDMKDDPCWDGYEMVGKKNKDGHEVPNCVPKKKAGLGNSHIFYTDNGGTVNTKDKEAVDRFNINMPEDQKLPYHPDLQKQLTVNPHTRRIAGKAEQLLKEALNPGGVSFDVGGNTSNVNPLSRTRDPREETFQYPSKNKKNPDGTPAVFESQRFKGPEQRRQKGKIKSYDKTPLSQNLEQLYPSLYEQKKPGAMDMIRDFLGKTKDHLSQTPVGEFAKNVGDYANVGYKGKHDAPAEPNKVQKFLDWLKGVHQKMNSAPTPPPTENLFNKTKSLVDQDRVDANDSRLKPVEDRRSVNLPWQQNHPTVASKEVVELLKTALEEESDYKNILTAMNEFGYSSGEILKAFS